MSQEILQKLGELKAGQEHMKRQLAGQLEGLAGQLEGFEAKLDTLSEDFKEHRKSANDNFELVLASLNALRKTADVDGEAPSLPPFSRPH